MSLPIFMRVIICTSILLGISTGLDSASARDWKVDLSRRKALTREPASVNDSADDAGSAEAKGFIGRLIEGAGQAQDVVVLLTDRGFTPRDLRVKRGETYRIHVVNVNEREKNVSFVLDAFSEHHAAFYGRIRTFEIRPQKEGVFKFFSPETAAQGRLVVIPQNLKPQDEPFAPTLQPVIAPDVRTPAGE